MLAASDALYAFLFFGGGGFVVALVLALAIPPTPRRVLALFAGGVAIMGGFFLLFYLNAPPAEGPAQSDSTEFYGRHMDGLAFWFPTTNLIGWFLGVPLGLLARKGLQAVVR